MSQSNDKFIKMAGFRFILVKTRFQAKKLDYEGYMHTMAPKFENGGNVTVAKFGPAFTRYRLRSQGRNFNSRVCAI